MQALCGASSHSIGKSTAGCAVSIRLTDDGQRVEEFYDVAGAPRYRHGRQVFFSHRRYDGVLFIYDLTDPSTRSSISCTWVPEVMAHLGDIGAIETGGRMDGEEAHVRSAGVIHELRFLWRQMLFSHSRVSPMQAFKESARLSWRLVRLLMNELGFWPDSSLDEEAERVFLATSLVPCALIGMKSDLIDRGELRESEFDGNSKGVPDIKLHANSVAHDKKLQAFLCRVAESAKRRASTPTKSHGRTGSGQVLLGFS